MDLSLRKGISLKSSVLRGRVLTKDFEVKLTSGRNIKRMIMSSNKFLSFSRVKNVEKRVGGKVWPMKRCNSGEAKF